LMDVYGDGKSTLWELIMTHPNARHRPEEMRIKHEQNLQSIIPKGERYILTYAANLNRGAKFSDLYQHVDDGMLKLFDEISHRAKFYYGRYDIKCRSIEDLKQKKNFTILEFNGSGAEPNHPKRCALLAIDERMEIFTGSEKKFGIAGREGYGDIGVRMQVSGFRIRRDQIKCEAPIPYV
jgi:hypothetical protein